MELKKTMRRKMIIVRILLVLLAVYIGGTLNVMAAEKSKETVSSKEQKEIKRFLDKYAAEYLGNCCWELRGDESLKMNSEKFIFNGKRKTDMVVSSIDLYTDLNSEWVEVSTNLWNKYKPYGGLVRYSGKTKELIKKNGKKIFGESFTVSFATNVPDSRINEYLYPRSKDKKYLVCRLTDSGEWGADYKYTSIVKKKGTYLVYMKYTYGNQWEEPKEIYTNKFLVKLKKNKSVFSITDIECF